MKAFKAVINGALKAGLVVRVTNNDAQNIRSEIPDDNSPHISKFKRHLWPNHH